MRFCFEIAKVQTKKHLPESGISPNPGRIKREGAELFFVRKKAKRHAMSTILIEPMGMSVYHKHAVSFRNVLPRRRPKFYVIASVKELPEERIAAAYYWHVEDFCFSNSVSFDTCEHFHPLVDSGNCFPEIFCFCTCSRIVVEPMFLTIDLFRPSLGFRSGSFLFVQGDIRTIRSAVIAPFETMSGEFEVWKIFRGRCGFH